jgi:putative tryptophan/tyrosine transport system substrate-binding protein
MTVRRAALALVLTGCLSAAPLAAQPPAKVYTIGTLSAAATSDPRYGPIFASALHDGGYHPGRNLVLESRYAAGKVERLPELAADLVRRRVDLILAFGAAESLAAVNATTTIPVVFVSPSPVELGLVGSLARPGGNATGVSADAGPAVSGKLLELLKTMVPGLSRVDFLIDPDRPGLAVWEEATRKAAQALRVELRMLPVHQESDLDDAFARIARDRPGALLLTADSLILLHLKRITDFAVRHRLPTVSYVRTMVDDGCLMSYGPNFGDLMRRAASYMDRILKGARPAELPVEQPTKFDLVINVTTAKSLGLTIPQPLLLRADEVVK